MSKPNDEEMMTLLNFNSSYFKLKDSEKIQSKLENSKRKTGKSESMKRRDDKDAYINYIVKFKKQIEEDKTKISILTFILQNVLNDAHNLDKLLPTPYFLSQYLYENMYNAKVKVHRKFKELLKK